MYKNIFDGFVLFTACKGIALDHTIGAVITGDRNMRLTDGAISLLGNPEYVNVFFDEPGKRMMIRKAEKDMPNIFRIQAKSFQCLGVIQHIHFIAGTNTKPGLAVRFEGIDPKASGCVIIDLNKHTVISTAKAIPRKDK